MNYKTCDKFSCKLTKLIYATSNSELQTLRDVLKYDLFFRRIEENYNNLRQTYEQVWASVKDLWQKANPLITIVFDKRGQKCKLIYKLHITKSI